MFHNEFFLIIGLRLLLSTSYGKPYRKFSYFLGRVKVISCEFVISSEENEDIYDMVKDMIDLVSEVEIDM